MKIYFCPECGAYDFGDGNVCADCDEPIPDDSWADVSVDELAELDFAEEYELPPGLPSWEYEVIRFESVAQDDKRNYALQLLNSMGDKGWELVSIEAPDGQSTARFGVFKRAWLDYF